MAFYVVETIEQLNALHEKHYDRIFIEPIYFNNRTHPSLNDISLLYLKPLDISDKGYMLCLNHNESLSLPPSIVKDVLSKYKEVYVRDRKSLIYFYPYSNIIDISFNAPEFPDPKSGVYDYFYHKHGDVANINTAIPLVKHYEKCELIYNKINKYCIKPHNNTFNNRLINVFFAIERNGVKIDKSVFNRFYELNNDIHSLKEDTLYTHYNLYTTTGRPANSFNGINFGALIKDNGCRASFTANNDYLVEIDINSYHPTLAAQLIDFDLKDETPYQYFSREASIDISEAKILMFRQLYGGIYKEYQHIEYFKLIQEYQNKLWETFNKDGSIKCPISERMLYNTLPDMNAPKLFNYLLQNMETSTNVLILWDVIKLLKGKQTKIVLTTYDSFLFDYHKKDNILEELKQIFTKHKLKTKLTHGINYDEMSLI